MATYSYCFMPAGELTSGDVSVSGLFGEGSLSAVPLLTISSMFSMLLVRACMCDVTVYLTFAGST